jgi:DNA (cytosine-5)-methyltransferase 1
MGLPEGHVTDPAIWVGVTRSAARNAQLKLCGNGVVPQQAEAAIRLMLDQITTERAA